MQNTRVRRRLAAIQTLLALAILIAPCAPVLAGDEAHQLVRSYQATFLKDGAELRITLRLANGDEVQALYDAEATPRIVRILELGMRPGASLHVDLKGKQVTSISVEYGRP
jgi:hypothetical protein